MDMRFQNSKRFRAPLLLAPLGLALVLFTFGCRQASEQDIEHRVQVAAGKSSFRAYCAGCHGHDGKGDGPAAEYMTIPPADLTQITKRYGEFPSALIYNRIDGTIQEFPGASQQMPHWAEIWSETDTEWDSDREIRLRINELIAFLETIQDNSAEG